MQEFAGAASFGAAMDEPPNQALTRFDWGPVGNGTTDKIKRTAIARFSMGTLKSL